MNNANTVNVITEAVCDQLMTGVTGVGNIDYYTLFHDTWYTQFNAAAIHESFGESMHQNYEGFEGTEKLTLWLLTKFIAENMGVGSDLYYCNDLTKYQPQHLLELITYFSNNECSDNMRLTVFRYILDLTIYCYNV